MINPYPLLLTPLLFEKVWGGRRLESLGKSLPAGKAIGESWELADLSATSASGAGGGAAISPIASGPLAGRTLRDAVALWGRDLLGSAALTGAGGFPLLVKFLDASENLSVQVHPSPAYASAHAGAAIKTECWYVLSAEPGSVIYKGVKPGVTRASFARKIAAGTVAEDLVAVPAQAGECHNLPSGTVHALGKGVLVAEVQTPSDTTFRVFDWGRAGRELHVEQALECIDFDRPAPPAARLPAGKGAARLVSTDFFRLYESVLPAGGLVGVVGDDPSREPRALIVLEGSVSIRCGRDEPVVVPRGGTCLIPAACAPALQAVARPRTRVLTVSLR